MSVCSQHSFKLPTEHVEDRKPLKQEVDLEDRFDYSRLESMLLEPGECLSLFIAAKFERVTFEQEDTTSIICF